MFTSGILGGEVKKSITIFLFFLGGLLYANDYRWDLITALSRFDYPAVENIINQNIDTMPAAEKRQLINLALSYSYGDTILNTLELLQRHNVRSGGFDLYTAIGSLFLS